MFAKELACSSIHVLLSPLDGDYRPDVACGNEHQIHQESGQASVAIHARMHVDEEEVPQHRAHLGLSFSFQKFGKDRHAFPHRLLRKRNVQGATDEYLVIAIARKVGCLEDAGLYAWTEERLVPPGQCPLEYRAGIFTLYDSNQILLHQGVSLKVSACGHGIAGSAVFVVAIRIPAPVANFLDESGCDAIPLYGERVVGVRYVARLHIFQNRADIPRSVSMLTPAPRRGRSCCAT